MTNGTAKIETRDGQVILTYMTIGSFLLGEQRFGNSREGWNAALKFCRERGLRVMPTTLEQGESKMTIIHCAANMSKMHEDGRPMWTDKQAQGPHPVEIKATRVSTGEVRRFETEAEAVRFCLRRGDVNELWRIEQ